MPDSQRDGPSPDANSRDVLKWMNGEPPALKGRPRTVRPVIDTPAAKLLTRQEAMRERQIGKKEALERLRIKAYDAVESGLDCPKDEYKRAGLGVQVLKGVGDLAAETAVNVTLQTAIAAVPQDWLDRYVLSDPTDPARLSQSSLDETETSSDVVDSSPTCDVSE